MTKFIATLAAAALLVSAQAPAYAGSDRGKEVAPVAKQSAQKSNSGKSNVGKVALGLAIGAGVVIAAFASQAKADEGKQSYVYRVDADGDRGMCRVWRTDCRYGSERACYKYESRC